MALVIDKNPAPVAANLTFGPAAGDGGSERKLSMRVRVLPERWWTLPPPTEERIERVRYDALPDPFEPLLAIWRLGYALGGFDEETFELFAPPAPLEP